MEKKRMRITVEREKDEPGGFCDLLAHHSVIGFQEVPHFVIPNLFRDLIPRTKNLDA